MTPTLNGICARCGEFVHSHPVEADFECRDCGVASCVSLRPGDHFPDCPGGVPAEGRPDEPLPFCGSCRYYDADACRRYPPARVYTGPAATDLNVTVWPVVRPTIDWCGEHEFKS